MDFVAGSRLFGLAVGLVGFSILHSVLAVPRVRDVLTRRLGVGARGYRLAYSLLSIAVFAPLLVLAFGSLPRVWSATGAVRWLLWIVQPGAALGILWTLGSIRLGSFLGLRAEVATSAGGLRTTGAYALCRHPLYFFVALFASSAPDMHAGRLILALWLWAYGIVGSIFEERRLVDEFGDEYRRYRRTHHRILPFGRTHAPRSTPR